MHFLAILFRDTFFCTVLEEYQESIHEWVLGYLIYVPDETLECLKEEGEHPCPRRRDADTGRDWTEGE